MYPACRTNVINKPRRVGRFLYTRAVFLLAFALFPYTAESQQCPGTNFTTITAMVARASSMTATNPDPDELAIFISAGCTTDMFGPNPPNLCSVFTAGGGNPALQAFWVATTQNVTSNGCTFNCPGGTCRVRGADALPVELMEFSIENG